MDSEYEQLLSNLQVHIDEKRWELEDRGHFLHRHKLKKDLNLDSNNGNFRKDK